MGQPASCLFGDFSGPFHNSSYLSTGNSFSLHILNNSRQSSSKTPLNQYSLSTCRFSTPRDQQKPYSTKFRLHDFSCHIKCMVCGRDDHRFGTCNKEGRILHKINNRWQDSSGTSFCFGYNGLQGCRTANCTYKHACSLCGENVHSAQDCSH